MKAAILTPWFPPELQPVREGVYQRLTEQGCIWHSAYRHARWWPCTSLGADTADEYARREWAIEDPAEHKFHWRGLASDPSGSAA